MKTLLWLQHVLLGCSLMGVQVAESHVKLEVCVQGMEKMQMANMTSIIECMSRAVNLTAYMEETLLRVDMLERVIDRLRRRPQVEEHIASPYVNIDDVLQINGSVSGYSCEGKLQVIQAVRRKLAQLSTLHGVESTLFKWPYKRALNVHMNLNMSSSDGAPRTLKSISFHSYDEEDEDLSCIIAKAIRKNNEKFANG